MMGKLLYFKSWQFQASVAELVDALDLKSNWNLNSSAGSSPARGTQNKPKYLAIHCDSST